MSADETTFNKSTDIYNNALAESGFKSKITFQQQKDIPTVTGNIKNRKKKIILFNPPFSLNVSTNIRKKFFTPLGKHFPKTHQVHKLLNFHNVKISYSSLPNFKSVINGHNKNILSEQVIFSSTSERNSTEFSNFILGKKKEKTNVNLDWSIFDKANTLFSIFKKMHVMSYKEISHHFLYKKSVE